MRYNELDVLSERLALSLKRDCNVRPRDRVIVFLDNCMESVIAMYGILKANAVFVMVHGAVKARKLAYILKDARPRALITQSAKAEVIGQVFQHEAPDLHLIWRREQDHIPPALRDLSMDWDRLTTNTLGSAHWPDGNAIERCIDLDLAALIYTSGTTGEPKGVMATHHNMISAARSIIQYLENTPDDRILNVLPLSFGYGLYQVIAAVMFGGTVVLENSLTYIHKVLEQIPEKGITGFPFVPTVLAIMLNLRNLQKYDFSSLRYVTNAGAALPVPYIRKFRALFPGITFFSMYGLTECARASYLEPDKIDVYPASVGKAIPNCELFLVDTHGETVKAGEIGELVVRGANVMKGYWNAPELTEKVFQNGRFPGDRFLYTGDFFKQDKNGYLYFIGRKDDLIKCAGERICAREIEDVICEIGWVKEAAVIGIPDAITGQAVKAFVVNGKNGEGSTERIISHCRLHLEPHAVPKYIAFLDMLPKTDNGKIDKNLLRQNAING